MPTAHPIVIQVEAAQGDLYVRRLGALPADAREVAAAPDGRHVVAHSETGHDHFTDGVGVRHFARPDDPLVCYLAIEGPYADLVHGRAVDTHAPLRLGAGCWEIRRQRELAPEGWRKVED